MIIISFQLFSNEWIKFVAFFIAIFILIGIAEFFRSKLKWRPEASRKLVHVIVGLVVSISPLIFTSNIQPMTLAGIFIVVNSFTLKSNAFKSMHTAERTTYGTVYFPFAFLVLAAFYWEKPITLILSMLVMTISDTLATYTGEREKLPIKFRLWNDQKTLQGSAAMFLSTFLIIYVGTDFFAWFFDAAFFLPMGILIGCAVFTGIAVMFAEAISNKGSDNFSVPLITAGAYDIYLINYTHGTLPTLLLWTFSSAFVLIFTYKLKSLNAGGAAGAFIMGIFVFGTGGVQWITPMLAFFILSSILSKIGKKSTEATQNGSRRNLVQVMANGGVPMMIALVNFYQPFHSAYILFLGAIAAATADTWATEIGFFSRKKPRHIFKCNTVEKGASGGVTLLGFLGSFLGAGSIALIGGYWLSGGAVTGGVVTGGAVTGGMVAGDRLAAMAVLILAGFIGSLMDSILGGSVQAMFRCGVCNKETEKRIHCDVHADHIGGFKWLDNDGVNFVNTLVGVAVIGSFVILIK